MSKFKISKLKAQSSKLEMAHSMIDEEAYLAELDYPAFKDSVPVFESLFGLLNLIMTGISGQLPSYCYFSSDDEAEKWLWETGGDAGVLKNIYLYLVDISLLEANLTSFSYFRKNSISCLHEVVDRHGLP